MVKNEKKYSEYWCLTWSGTGRSTCWPTGTHSLRTRRRTFTMRSRWNLHFLIYVYPFSFFAWNPNIFPILTLDPRKFLCSDRKISRTLTSSKKFSISFAIMIKDYSLNMWYFLISWTTNIKLKTFHRIFAVVLIRDILLRTRIRIMLFSSVPFRTPRKYIFNKIFCLLLFEGKLT